MGFTPSKWTGNEAWLRSMSSDKEKFDTGMSFIKNAKASANLARNMAAQEQTQLNQGMSPNDYYERGEHWRDTSGDVAAIGPDYEIGEHWNIDDTPFGLTETEDITADYTPYPDEKWGAPINYNPYRDEDYGAPLYGFRKGRKPNLASLFGIPAFMDTEESYGLMPGAKLPYDMSEEEETFIKPNTDLRGKYLPR